MPSFKLIKQAVDQVAESSQVPQQQITPQPQPTFLDRAEQIRQSGEVVKGLVDTAKPVVDTAQNVWDSRGKLYDYGSAAIGSGIAAGAAIKSKAQQAVADEIDDTYEAVKPPEKVKSKPLAVKNYRPSWSDIILAGVNHDIDALQDNVPKALEWTGGIGVVPYITGTTDLRAGNASWRTFRHNPDVPFYRWPKIGGGNAPSDYGYFQNTTSDKPKGLFNRTRNWFTNFFYPPQPIPQNVSVASSPVGRPGFSASTPMPVGASSVETVFPATSMNGLANEQMVMPARGAYKPQSFLTSARKFLTLTPQDSVKIDPMWKRWYDGAPNPFSLESIRNANSRFFGNWHPQSSSIINSSTPITPGTFGSNPIDVVSPTGAGMVVDTPTTPRGGFMYPAENVMGPVGGSTEFVGASNPAQQTSKMVDRMATPSYVLGEGPFLAEGGTNVADPRSRVTQFLQESPGAISTTNVSPKKRLLFKNKLGRFLGNTGLSLGEWMAFSYGMEQGNNLAAEADKEGPIIDSADRFIYDLQGKYLSPEANIGLTTWERVPLTMLHDMNPKYWRQATGDTLRTAAGSARQLAKMVNSGYNIGPGLMFKYGPGLAVQGIKDFTSSTADALFNVNHHPKQPQDLSSEMQEAFDIRDPHGSRVKIQGILQKNPYLKSVFDRNAYNFVPVSPMGPAKAVRKSDDETWADTMKDFRKIISGANASYTPDLVNGVMDYANSLLTSDNDLIRTAAPYAISAQQALARTLRSSEFLKGMPKPCKPTLINQYRYEAYRMYDVPRGETPMSFKQWSKARVAPEQIRFIFDKMRGEVTKLYQQHPEVFNNDWGRELNYIFDFMK